jgi:hypothetical protein
MYRYLFFAFLASASTTHAQQPARSAPTQIFREVQFPPYAPIRLGEAIRSNAPPGQRRGTDRIVLSGFGGTDSITIQLDRSSHVVALRFVYPDWRSYSSLVDGYLAVLEQPASRVDADSAEGRIERAVWQDSLTRFELRRFSRGEKTLSLTSLLTDRSPTQVDPSRQVVSARWNGEPVWIAGATSATDSASPQFWVDKVTNATARAIFSPVPGARQMDMHLANLLQLDGDWLATRCEFFVAGKLTLTEEYQDWKVSVELSPGRVLTEERVHG